jgi:uncharacterized membrane protein required for colicin V production
MTIWLLAIVLLASLAGLGYRQGAIRVAFSLVGIIIAAMLAVPLGKFVMPALKALGVANPVLLWALPPFVVFVVVLAAFKIGALTVHQKVDVYYKYKAGDLRLALFERLNARLGLCLGLVNGLVYLILLSFVIHAFSYWTVQVATSDEDPRGMRILNRLGRDLQSTGMSRVAGAVSSLPDDYYETADLTGLIYQNPLTEARLSRYPGFISLGLRPDFQALGQDEAFKNMRLTQTSIRQVMAHPTVEPIVKDPATLRLIWDTLKPDLKDVETFLREGKSENYTEEILGRWQFDVSASAAAYRRSRPTLPAAEVQKFRRFLADRFARTTLIAGPDHQMVIRNLPQLQQQPNQPPTAELQTLEGKWQKTNGDYEFDLAGGTDRRTARIESGRLVMSGDNIAIVLMKED